MKHSHGTFINKTSKMVVGAGLASAIPWDSITKANSLISANYKINVGAIGINGMGWADLSSMSKIPGVNVAALCDVDDNVLNYRKYELAQPIFTGKAG